jgi:Fe-S cluster assembly ATPase SufC
MEKPLELVTTGKKGDELILHKTNINILKGETRAVTVVSIVGPNREGKSYLMNRLMGKSDGFPLGHTTCSTTQGFWFWKGDFPGDNSR